MLRDLVLLAVDEAFDRSRKPLHLLYRSVFVCSCQALIAFDPLDFLARSFLLTHQALQRVEAFFGWFDRACFSDETLG